MTTHLRRREVITLLGGAAAWPFAALAQQRALPVVGYLYSAEPETSASRVAAFREGLSEAGFIEGRNVAIEYRFAYNKLDRLPELAADLVRRRVTVIVTPGSMPAALAAKAATRTIPVVFAVGDDPVKAGLVASLNRPGGNLTGVNTMSWELGSRRIGLLHELLPEAARFAVLLNPNQPNADSLMTDAQTGALAIGGQIEILSAGANREIDVAFASLLQKRTDALMVSPDALFVNRRVHLVTLAARHAIPTIYPFRDHVDIGGLMSYGALSNDTHRLAGVYAGSILNGKKPSDLPIMRPTKFEFVVNMQTARTLGIEVPSTLLAIADEVIE